MRWNLPPSDMPTTWFNVVPRLKEPLQPPLHPATGQAVAPDDLAPLFPMALIAQEVSTEPSIEIPGEVLDVLRLWRPTPLVRADPPREGAGHAGPHLLQGRVGLPCRLPQAQHRRPPGLLQQGRRGRPADDRDRGRPVGQRPVPSRRRSSGSSARSTWCGPRTSRSPTGASSWRPGAATWSRPRSTSRTTPGSLGIGHQRRGRRRRAAAPTPTTRSARCSTTCCCTRPSSARRPSAAGAGRRGRARRRHRLLRRRLQPGRHQPALRPRRGRAPGGGRADLVPHPHRRAVRVRLRRHRRVHPAPAHVHARARLRPAVDPRRRAALPRRLADHLAPWSAPAGWRPSPTRKPTSSRRRSCSARTQGTVPAPETGHAIRAVIDEALAAKERGEEKVILFNYSGHGLLDLSAYDAYLHGQTTD